MRDPSQIQREAFLRRAVLHGDETAWKVLYDDSFASLEKYIFWRCGQRRDWAEEIVQETWLIAVRKIREFDPQQAQFASWLSGIAGNLLRNQLRKWLKDVKRRSPLIDESREDSPVENDGERIALALSELSERNEQVLKQKYLEQLTVEQIASDWGETPKAIESLLTRAREAFREAFERKVDHASK